jgi:hypothetical protein
MAREQRAAGYDHLKIQEGLSADAYDSIVVAAKAAGIRFAGHVPDAVGVARVLAAGQASVDHFDNYAATLDADGAVSDAEIAALARRVQALLPRLAAALALVVACWLGSAWLRVLRAAEAAALGRPFLVEAGPRDLFFLRSGFGRLRFGDGPTTRACPVRCSIQLPLAAGRPHLLQIRFVSDAPVLIALNGTSVGRLESTEAGAFGAVTLALPGPLIRKGLNQVELRPLSGSSGTGLRLWYFRIEPSRP